MAYRTFRLSAGSTEAETQIFNDFLRSHRVLAIQKEWLSQAVEGGWSFCVEYEEGAAARPAASGQVGKIDYREVLPPEQFEVFARLRSLRKALAERDAVPVFTVFTNAQLAEMVKMPARTVADLAKIDGIGEARVAKYGKEVLGELKRAAPPMESKQDETGENAV